MSDCLQPHGLQHAWPPCPSPTPAAYSYSGLSHRWCHPTISSSVVPFSSHLQSFPSIRVFSNESVLHIRWPKYWSFRFSISPSNEYSGLISFRIDWLDLLTPSSNNTREDSTHGYHQMVNTEIRLIIFYADKDEEALYSQPKQDQVMTMAQIMSSLLTSSD